MKSLLWLLLFPLVGAAQRPALYFEKLGVQHGLSHNKVNCMLQDQRGFMWIGTDDGLNRYDGRHFVHFTSVPTDTTTLSGNIVTKMLEDKDGRLWIATADGGISRYDYRLPPRQQFKRYNQVSEGGRSVPVNAVNALIEDRAGNLWLGTSGQSVMRFEKASGRVNSVTGSTKTILDLCADKEGTIWAGRQGGGLLKINPATLAFSEDARYSDLYAKLPHVTVTALYNDRQGFMWYGSWDKVLYRYSPLSGGETAFAASTSTGFVADEIRCFAEDAEGWLWLGGKDKGLQLYHPKTGRFYNYGHNPAVDGTLADNRVNCIFVDRNGRVWVGTNQGVSVNNPLKQNFWQEFLPRSGVEPITVYDFFETAGGEIWIGTSAGIFIRRPDGSLLKRTPTFKGQPLQVSLFFPAPDGTLYLGTNYSLFRYNAATNIVALLPHTEKDSVMNGITASRVVSAVSQTIDGRPTLLLSPYGHYLAYYDLERQRWVSRLDSSNIVRRFPLADNLIRKLHKAADGTLLLATQKKGLGIWPAGAQTVSYLTFDPANPASLTNNNVSDICEAGRGRYWVATYGGGLHLFDAASKRFTHIGGSNNLIEGVQLDGRGQVWMISNGSLQKYDPFRKTFSTYQLPDVEKTGGVRGKIFRDSRGRLYVAGTNYFIRFHPDSLSTVKTEPKVVFTDFQIFNQSFSQLLGQERITLKYKENYFAIEFAAPDFAPGRAVRYAYKLDGFDPDWVDAGSRNYVSYSNLSGGDYTFTVRVTNTPGTWSPQVASLKLTVIPPYWKQPLFYVLCALLLALAIYLLYNYRINELLKRQAIRNRIAQDLHDNVGSTLSSISVYSQVAKIYQQKAQETELRGTLEKISDTSTEMISELNDTVWAINPRNDNMEVILQRMESFARPLLAAQNIRFHFDYDAALPLLNLEMEKRKSFYAIFKEAVSNASKYRGCENLWVRIHQKGHRLYMAVRDDGRGFDLSKTSEGYKSSDVFGGGNGLKNMQQRASAMKGQLKMRSEPGRGTTVELAFPIP